MAWLEEHGLTTIALHKEGTHRETSQKYIDALQEEKDKSMALQLQISRMELSLQSHIEAAKHEEHRLKERIRVQPERMQAAKARALQDSATAMTPERADRATTRAQALLQDSATTMTPVKPAESETAVAPIQPAERSIVTETDTVPWYHFQQTEAQTDLHLSPQRKATLGVVYETQRGRPSKDDRHSAATQDRRASGLFRGVKEATQAKEQPIRVYDAADNRKRDKEIKADLVEWSKEHGIAVPRVLFAALHDDAALLEELTCNVQSGIVKNRIIEQHIAKQQQWLRERSLPTKEILNLSEHAYDHYLHCHCDNFDQATKRYIPELIDGRFPMPRPEPRNKVCEDARAMFDDLNFKSTHGVEGGGIGLEEAIRLEMEMRGIQEDKIAIQISGDGANMGKMTQTAIVFKILGVEEGGDYVHVPELITTVAFYNGDDKYEQAANHTDRLADDIARIRKDGIQTVDGRKVEVVVFYGGDLKWINGVNGMAGCSHTYPCPWCEGKGKEAWGDLFAAPAKKRTTERLKELSHTATTPFWCGCCEEKFENEDDLERNADGWRDYSEFNLAHYGCKMGDAPLFPMEDGPLDGSYIACSLHLVLRLVGNAYTWVVRSNLQGKDGERRANQVNAVLKELGICVRKATKPKKKDQIHDAMGKNLSLNGRDCQLLLGTSKGDGKYHLLFEAVELQGEQLEKARAMFEALVKLKEAVLAKFDGPTDLFKTDRATLATRKVHADEIHEAALTYKKAWLAYCDVPERMPIYVHIAECHLPAMTMAVGSLTRFSMQGEEHLHSVRKRDKKTQSSMKPVGSKGALKKDGTHAIVKRGHIESQIKREKVRAWAKKQIPQRPRGRARAVAMDLHAASTSTTTPDSRGV